MNFNEMKKEFRKTKTWKEFTKSLKAERKVDALTQQKLRKGSLSHHMDLNPDHYEDLDPDKFEAFNMKSHDVVHFMYNYYKKDPTIIERLELILHKMYLLNEVNK
jgi:hypothetical protein